jgi:ABC-type Mn2+/Zn2+ transport system permease subunit
MGVEMIELIQLYKWSILASTLLSMGLALLGIHLASRDRAMQTICVGQGAMLGVLLGIGVLQYLELHGILEQILPLTTALLTSIATFALSQSYLNRGLASANSHFGSLFAILLALAYLCSTLFPALESHMAQRYFGDVATISDAESMMIGVLGLGSIVCMSFFYKRFAEQSFDQALYGGLSLPDRSLLRLFELTVLLCLSLSVQTVGYLFTLACLFIPTTLSARHLKGGMKLHTIFCVILAPLATLLGFILSLGLSRLPTVPTIITIMVVVGWILVQILKHRRLEGG